MDDLELLVAIERELDRIFHQGLDGDGEEYSWLLETYGVTEEDDVRYQMIGEYVRGEFESENGIIYDSQGLEVEGEWMSFLEDNNAVIAFLTDMLTKLKTKDDVFIKSKT